MGKAEGKPMGNLAQVQKCHLHHNGPCTKVPTSSQQIGTLLTIAEICNANVVTLRRGVAMGHTPKGMVVLSVEHQDTSRDDGYPAKNERDKSERKTDRERTIVRDVPEVFSEDCQVFLSLTSGISIDFVPEAAPLLEQPYRIGPIDMKELSNNYRGF
ncbi:hypothetical protein Tco_0773398 [Tanacetum coccineum]|uniref:Uncharacterized protein n=1 Tax=Tanacetum coccineum TaxID=301880 RepID=A0ABQ4ZPB6_9ASTR